jgi:O-antigen/teichoic acid export membrane protein
LHKLRHALRRRIPNAFATEPLIWQNAIYFAGNLFALALAFLYQFLCGRLLGTERYSAVAAIFSLYFILLVPGLIVTTMGMRQAAVLHAAARLGELRLLFRRLTWRLVAASAVGAIGFALLVGIIAAFLRVPSTTLLVLVPAIVLLLPMSFNRGLLQGEQRFIWASSVPLVEAGTRTGLALILIAWGFGATGAILALSIGVVVSYAASLWPMRHVSRRARDGTERRLMVPTFLWPTVIAILGITLLYTVDVLLVKHFLPPRESGIYGSIVTLGRIIFMVTTSITTVMFAQVAARFSQARPTGRILGASAVLVATIAVVIILTFIAAPGLVLWPFGPSFRTAAPYLPLFGGAMTMLSLANLLVNYLVAIHNARFVFVLILADLAELVLISVFHHDLWTVIAIVFGVTSGTLVALLGVVVLGLSGRSDRIIAGFGARQT